MTAANLIRRDLSEKYQMLFKVMNFSKLFQTVVLELLSHLEIKISSFWNFQKINKQNRKMEFIFSHVAGNAAIFLELSVEVTGRAAVSDCF